MNVKRRIFSAFIAFVMLITLIPMGVTAESAEYSEYTFEYDFTRGIKDGVRVDTITKNMTDGFWWYDSINAGKTLSTFLKRSYGLQIGSGVGYYAAFGISVPAAGKYETSFKYSQKDKGGLSNVYLIPGDTADIPSALTSNNAVAEINFEGAGEDGLITKGKDVVIPKAGDYLLVYRAEKKGTINANMYVAGATLKGGEKTAVMSVLPSSSSLELKTGDETGINYIAILSDHSTVSKNDVAASFESSDKDVATVSADGVIKAVSVGEAVITINAEYNGTVASDKISVNVVSASGSGYNVSYDLTTNANKTDYRVTSYKDTKGFWRFYGTSPSWATTNKTFVIRSYGVQVNPGKNNWVAYEIDVPKSGEYDITLSHGQASQGCVADMFVLPGNTSNIDGSLIAENSAGKADFYASSEMLGGKDYRTVQTDIGKYVFETEGKYLVVFKYNSQSPNGGEKTAIYPGKIILNGGNKVALMYAELIVSGDMASITSAIMSDGSSADVSAADVVYSIENASVGTIDPLTGRITASKTGGDTKIFADVTFEGRTVRCEADVTLGTSVVVPSGVARDYVFTSRSDSWTTVMWNGANPRNDDVRGITYDYTDGNWEWGNAGPSDSVINFNSLVTSYSGEAVSARLRMTLKYGEWVALKLKVPAAGSYWAELSSAKISVSGGNSGVADIFIVPLADTRKEITSSLTMDNYVSTVSFAVKSNEFTKASDSLGIVNFKKAGEYLIVFREASKENKYITPKTLTLDGRNVVRLVNLNVEKRILNVGETSASSFTANLLDGTEISVKDADVIYTSDNEEIATFEGGVIRGVGKGTCNVKVTIIHNGVSASSEVPVTVEDKSEIDKLIVKGDTVSFVGDSAKLESYICYKSGYEEPYSPVEFVIVEGNGAIVDGNKLTSDSEGVVKVKALLTIGGTEFQSDIFEVNFIKNTEKTEPTYYTYAMREAARKNAAKYSWASEEVKAAKKSAEYYVENFEKLYNNIAYEGIPRSRQIGLTNDPDYRYCRYCQSDIATKYGNKSGGSAYKINLYTRPWKVQCPDCKRLFPSNDFEGLYKLTISKNNGIYNPEVARRLNAENVANGGKDYLKNELYPEALEKFGDANWGVDDGFGYKPGRVYSNGVEERHTWIAYYVHESWSSMSKAIQALSKAYVYTDDKKYGVPGAILVDRIADVFPSFDYLKYGKTWLVAHGSTGYGKIMGRINDCQYTQVWCEGADAFYPMYSDPSVIEYISQKAKEQGLKNPKNSAKLIWKNIEDGLLRETFKACKASQIYGNYGQQQTTLASAALVLDNDKESREMIDWAFQPGGRVRSGGKEWCDGGNLSIQFVDEVDRDGMGNESAPNYNYSWLTRLFDLANTLDKYSSDPKYNLYKYPKFAKMFTAYAPLVIAGSQTAQIADTGSTANTVYVDGLDTIIDGFNHLKDTSLGKTLAKYIYRRNGYTVDGLRYGIFSNDPESIQKEITDRLDENNDAVSEMMPAYGFSILRSGVKRGEGASSVNNLQDFWIYFGRTSASHSHFDALNLGIEAFGLNMAPEIGYPELTGANPNRLQWVRQTISHNTVVVDEKGQNAEMIHGTPMHFDDSGDIKVMDIDAPKAYRSASIYRRTVVTVKATPDVSYGVDFFRVKGGKVHTYSFHSQSNSISETSGLNLVPQVDASGNYVGTYAGTDSVFGEDPYTAKGSLKFAPGYTWLKNVDRAADVGKYSVDFNVTDFRHAINDAKGLHMRMTMLNDFKLNEVAIADGYVTRTSLNIQMPDTLKYVLAKRTGSNLDSLFTTVYEPYRNTRYLSDMEAVSITVKDGKEKKDDVAKAVKVTHTSGRIDYVVYATNNEVTYTVSDGEKSFDFRGIVGVYSVNKYGKVICKYVNDGDIIGDDSELLKAYSGVVSDFTKNINFEN